MQRNVLINLSMSILGILIALTAFIVLFIVYGNHDVGFWSLLTGFVAGICFHLHWLKAKDGLERWHNKVTLKNLHVVGLCAGLAGFATVIWYLFLTCYYDIPIMPISDSTIISAVWSLICGKWGFLLMYYTYKYEQVIQEQSAPILTESSG